MHKYASSWISYKHSQNIRSDDRRFPQPVEITTAQHDTWVMSDPARRPSRLGIEVEHGVTMFTRASLSLDCLTLNSMMCAERRQQTFADFQMAIQAHRNQRRGRLVIRYSTSNLAHASEMQRRMSRSVYDSHPSERSGTANERANDAKSQG